MKSIKLMMAGVLCGLYGSNVFASDLWYHIQNTRSACSGISDSMGDMKRMAGINTVVTGAGTVSAGGALGVGIAKSGVDSEIERLKQLQERQNQYQQQYEKIILSDDIFRDCPTLVSVIKNMQTGVAQNNLESAIDTENAKSKTLGNVRTGTLAGTAVLDTAGTIIATKNKVDDDLQTKIDNCVKSVKNLSNEEIRARTENTATDAELATANKIITNCRDWEFIDLSPIKKRATGAAVSSGAGAALAVIGAITSASANSSSVRHGEENKEKNLNTASNVLAGGATLGSGAATVFNATQISAIKKAADMADKCEEGLR